MKTFVFFASMASIAAYASITKEDEKPKPVDELRILEDMIGEWDEEMTNKQAGDTTKSITKKTWALGGKFIRMDGVWNPGKTEFQSLLAYDPMTKNYRTWYFDSAGTMPRNPMIGEWDAKARTMSWKAVEEGGITTVGVTTVVDKDNHHWTMKVTDKDGGVLADLIGANKRRKP